MRFILSTIILTIVTGLNGQGISDVIRYSEITPLGTARTVGVGSSFGAMGGDFSVIGINPAGIGTYRKSEFVITPGIGSVKTESTFVSNGQATRKSKSIFTIDNFGLVSTSSPSSADWITSNFAIGLSKLKDFDREFSFSGTSEGSITERWEYDINNSVQYDDLDLAFDADVFFDNGTGYLQSRLFPEDIITKSQDVIQSGSINELSLGWAGNYKNVLNLGASIGVPFVSFEETKFYNEIVDIKDTEGNDLFSNDLTYTEYLNTTGTGINFKLGAIFNAHKMLRLGASIHSPTWYALSDDYNSSLEYNFTETNISGSSGVLESPEGSFDYNFTSPWKFVGSIGSIYSLGDIKGFFNVDIEHLDFTAADINLLKNSNAAGDIEQNRIVNNEIDQELASVTNIRLGTELAYPLSTKTGLRLRFGYALLGSPYFKDNTIGANNMWSAGLGLRFDDVFIDFGYRRSTSNTGYIPYKAEDLSRDQNVNIETVKGRLEMTVGFKF